MACVPASPRTPLNTTDSFVPSQLYATALQNHLGNAGVVQVGDVLHSPNHQRQTPFSALNPLKTVTVCGPLTGTSSTDPLFWSST